MLPVNTKIVVEIIDGEDDELIGYAVCTVTETGAEVNGTDWRLSPEVYGTRSEAAAAAAI